MNRSIGFFIGIIIVVILIAIAFFMVKNVSGNETEKNIITLCSNWNNNHNCNLEYFDSNSDLVSACKSYYKVSDDQKAKELCYNLCKKNCNPISGSTGGDLV